MVIDKAKEQGFTVLYGDTDSIFFQKGDKSLDEAKALATDVNATLPGIMELEFENFYPAGIFVPTKTSDTGAKKKAFQLGDRSVTLAETMIASSKAGIAFDATIQVRNKFVEAYKEIMNMPV